MKKLGLIISQISLAPFLLVPQAFAQPQTTITIGAPKQFVPTAGLTVSGAISFILAVLVAIAVIAAVIFLVWGGIKWITSGGDKGKVDAARGTIVAAIIGLVVTLLAFVILNFVVDILGVGPNIFNICIPKLSGLGCS